MESLPHITQHHHQIDPCVFTTCKKRARDSALGDSTVMGSHDGLDGFQRMMKTKFKTKVRDASGM